MCVCDVGAQGPCAKLVFSMGPQGAKVLAVAGAVWLYGGVSCMLCGREHVAGACTLRLNTLQQPLQVASHIGIHPSQPPPRRIPSPLTATFSALPCPFLPNPGTFLRGVLDKVGVEPQVKRIGAYKSAGDQLLRKDM